MTKYQFVRFDGFIPRGDTKIGVNKSGLLRFSPVFVKTNKIFNFQYVNLYFDKIHNAVALKLIDKAEDGTMKITKDGAGATVSAKSFFKANNVDLESYSGRYEWQKILLPNIGDAFVLTLTKHEKAS